MAEAAARNTRSCMPDIAHLWSGLWSRSRTFTWNPNGARPQLQPVVWKIAPSDVFHKMLCNYYWPNSHNSQPVTQYRIVASLASPFRTNHVAGFWQQSSHIWSMFIVQYIGAVSGHAGYIPRILRNYSGYSAYSQFVIGTILTANCVIPKIMNIMYFAKRDWC